MYEGGVDVYFDSYKLRFESRGVQIFVREAKIMCEH